MKGRKLTAREQEEKLENCAAERRKVFNELCRHVAAGYSMDCFEIMGIESIKRYMSVYSNEFCGRALEAAARKGKSNWEQIGARQATGECIGNSRSWYYNMSNRYGWRDKVDLQAEHKGEIAVNVVSYASTQPPPQTPAVDTSTGQ